MSERERTETQPDVELDFFDESPTVQGAPRKDGGPRRRRRLPRRPPAPPGGPQLYRLGVLIVGAIVLAVILILVVQSCRANQRESAYEDYIESAGVVATESAALGRRLNQRLTTPGVQIEDLRGNVEGFRNEQEQLLQTARELQPPGPLIEQHESLIETMQLRVNGLDGLARALQQVAESENAEASGADLAEQAQRLVASDVVYLDVFVEPARAVLEEEGISIAVPESRFVQNEELGSPTAWGLVVERLTQSPQAGGLRGNGIEAVRVQPGGAQLSPTEDNTVRASAQLAFQVLVRNSGESQETQVPVRLVIQQDPVIRKEQVIDLINPGQTKTLTFRDLADISFSTRVTLKVTIEPVAGEENTANNTAQYPIIFTLG